MEDVRKKADVPERRKAKRVAHQEEGEKYKRKRGKRQAWFESCAIRRRGRDAPFTTPRLPYFLLFRTQRARSASSLRLFLSPVSINPYTLQVRACNNGGKFEEASLFKTEIILKYSSICFHSRKIFQANLWEIANFLQYITQQSNNTRNK